MPVCFLCGYWSQACISHFDDQNAAFQGGVKCGKSAVGTVAVEVCPKYCTYSLREINEVSIAILGLVYLSMFTSLCLNVATIFY